MAYNAELAEEAEKNYVITFLNYCNKECQARLLDNAQTHSLVNKLKLISEAKTFNDLKGIIRDTVKPLGNYKSLFRALPPDIDCLYEVELAGEGRLFFYNLKNKCFVVALKSLHISNDK